MRRWLPAPWLSAALFPLWLVLNHSIDVGHLLLAAVVALGVPWLSAPLRPVQVRMRRPGVLLRLVFMVGYDVLVSNLAVAAAVLRGRRGAPRSAFVVVPLALRDPSGLAALAVITTVVPGTVWCELAVDRGALLLHVFDLPDEAAFIAAYKARYEQPLMEIFE